MATIEAIENYGADVQTGLSRCVGNEGLYFKLIGMALADQNFGALGEALEAGDLKKAFESAHALKGVIGNLALTPLYDDICDIVEPLRHEEAGFPNADQYKKIMDGLETLQAIVNE